MEIKRETDIDYVRFNLRLLHLTVEKYHNIINDLDKNNILYSFRKIENNINILINLEEIQNTNILVDLINNITDKCDIYISIRSTYDHGGLDVPKNILDIIRALKCDLNFSFFIS